MRNATATPAIRPDARDLEYPIVNSLAAGLAGAVALTLVHETVRRNMPDAPRMDVLGERAIAKLVRSVGGVPPRGEALHRTALAGDLAGNSLYYSMVGSGDPATRPWLRGAVLGLLAGAGAVVLPPVLGLGRSPRGLTTRTKAMTVAYYLIGGLVAAGAARAMHPRA